MLRPSIFQVKISEIVYLLGANKYVTKVNFYFRHESKLSLHLYKIITMVLLSKPRISSCSGNESRWGLNNFT